MGFRAGSALESVAVLPRLRAEGRWMRLPDLPECGRVLPDAHLAIDIDTH